MDVFSLVMAFLTSTTSLAAALVQYQTAKIAAQAAKSPTRRRRCQNRRQRRRGCQIPNAPPRPPNPQRAAEGARIAASAAEGARRIIARPDAKKTPIGVLGAKKRFFSRLWGEKFANFSPQ